ncbi:MAG: antitoxin VbhA family protein [Oscillospiraceae bacterium]|nr:antitoxin VbhA family protein [Oscillospiraceae bacterium]
MEKAMLQKRAMDNAKASVEMEGFKITNIMEELCLRVLRGELSKDKYLAEYRKLRASYAVQP